MLARLVGRCPICGRRYLRLGRRADLVCRRCYETRLMDHNSDAAMSRMCLGMALEDVTTTLCQIVKVTGNGTVTGVHRLARECLARFSKDVWKERCR